jgi:hypothetical protein
MIAAATHIVVNTGLDWGQVIATVLPVLVSLGLALAAYLRARASESQSRVNATTIQALNRTADQHDTAISGIQRRINGGT